MKDQRGYSLLILANLEPSVDMESPDENLPLQHKRPDRGERLLNQDQDNGLCCCEYVNADGERLLRFPSKKLKPCDLSDLTSSPSVATVRQWTKQQTDSSPAKALR